MKNEKSSIKLSRYKYEVVFIKVMTIVAQMSDVDPWLLVFIWHAWDMIVITNLVYSNLKLRNQYDFYFNSVELVFFFLI